MKATQKLNTSFVLPKIKVLSLNYEHLVILLSIFMVVSLVGLSYVRNLNSNLKLEISALKSSNHTQLLLNQRLTSKYQNLSDHNKLYHYAIKQKMSLPELKDEIIV